MNHSKGEWKPKKIEFVDSCIYTIWIQDGLSLNFSNNKSPLYIIPEITFPNKNVIEIVQDEKEMEANIKLMASAPKLLEALIKVQDALCTCDYTLDYTAAIDKMIIDVIHEAKEGRFK
jgi:hypothetical protein